MNSELDVDEKNIKLLVDQVRSVATQQLKTEDIQERAAVRNLYSHLTTEVVSKYLIESGINLSSAQKEELLVDVFSMAHGGEILNKLDKLQNVSDVFINGTKNTILTFRNGQKQVIKSWFRSIEEMRTFLINLRVQIGMHDSAFDPHHPSFNTRLPNGMRIHATHTSNNIYSISVRIPNRDLTSLDHLYQNGTIDEKVRDFLVAAVKAKLNIIIAGSTGAGKTALLLCMLGHLEKNERIITIEDSLELDVEKVHPSLELDVQEFEYLAPNSDGVGEVTARERLKDSLRMFPDRIIVGEVRDEIARELLSAMATGNDGSLSTIHARSPRTILDRLVDCSGLTNRQVHESVRNSVEVFIHITKTNSGERRITEIAQVTEQRGPNDSVVLEPIFIGGGRLTVDGASHPAKCSNPSGEVLAKLSAVGWGSDGLLRSVS